MGQLRFFSPTAAAGFIIAPPRVSTLGACWTHTGAHAASSRRRGCLSAASPPQRTALLVLRRINLSCRVKRPVEAWIVAVDASFATAAEDLVSKYSKADNPFLCGIDLCNCMYIDITSDLELGRPNENRERDKHVNGIYWIILLNIGVYVADHVLKLREVKMLYLYHSLPAWYQFVTATFCHANWNHLSSNLFFLYIFGKLVEEEEGNFALWISYILTGAGANLVSWLVLPTSAVSVGASGAVFGLFAISVLVKMSWDWRKILEVLILGQFVIDKVMEAAQASTGLGRGYSYVQNVNHIAHLSGALIGAALVWLISRISSGQDTKALRRDDDDIS